MMRSGRCSGGGHGFRHSNLHRPASRDALTAFETVADIVEWPQMIRSIRSVELLTPGPVHAGTRLREQRIMFGHETTEEMRIAEIERPRRLRLVAENHEINYELDHLIDSLGTGSRLMLVFRSKSGTSTGRALLSVISPLMEIKLRDELEQDLADLAAAISAKSAAANPRDRRRRAK
jgi:hypothetical protein